MLIIPVIDLLAGQVVHAIKGERHKYQPVQSILTADTSPEAILDAYFKLYSFNKIYIADLDAIQNKGEHFSTIKEIACRYPACEFWLDAGLELIKNRQIFSGHKNIRVIIGSENDFSEQEYTQFIGADPNIILSLDFDTQANIKNDFLFNSSCLWPKDVIILMLHRVGSNQGFDRACLDKIKKHGKQSRLYAGGGTRDISDIYCLKEYGFNGVLIASAIHNGSINNKDLIEIMEN